MNSATIGDVVKVNKCVRRLKNEEVILKFPSLGNIENVKMVCFSDASFANLKDGSSQGAYISFLVGMDGNFAPLSWHSRKVRRVVKSTLGAETLALASGAESCILLRTLLAEILKTDKLIPIVCKTDSKSLKEVNKNT